jgi:hypothetical protein
MQETWWYGVRIPSGGIIMPRKRNPEALRIEKDYRRKQKDTGRTANTKTPQTARQRSAVAKRKIGSQVSSASQGRTKSKEPALDKVEQTLKSVGKTLIKLAKTPGEIVAKRPGLAIKKGKMGAKNQPKAAPKKKAPVGKHLRQEPTPKRPAAAKSETTRLNPKRPDNYVSAADRKLLEGNPAARTARKRKRKASAYRG